MSRHICKNPNCNCVFEYCRACVFRPVRYKDAGFCSKECYEASKKVVEPIVDDISIIEVNESLVEQTEAETTALTEIVAEEIIMEEPIVKKETNTYKKKKNKYEVHE